MDRKTWTIEHFLYGSAFLLALGLRLWELGAAPLADYEAQWALQALDLSQSHAAIGPQPAYVLLTAPLFGLLGSTNFLARLLPALAGSLLTLFPLLFYPHFADSQRLRTAAVIMSFGLALDPGLIALSRLAGSPILAVWFLLLALSLHQRRQPLWAGIAGGLALLSGPAMLQGILGLLAGWGLLRLLEKRLKTTEMKDNSPTGTRNTLPLDIVEQRKAWLALGGALLAIGTLFLRAPQGLSAMVRTLPAYFEGFLYPPILKTLGTPVLAVLYQLLTLVIYHPLALIFGLSGIIRGWAGYKNDRESALAARLSLWFAGAMLLAFLYPDHQVGDLAWALIPLWALATIEICYHLDIEEEKTSQMVAGGLALLIMILAAIMQFNLLGLARFSISPLLYLGLMLGVLFFGAAAVSLVGFGWSTRAARLGVVWGLTITLLLGMIAQGWWLAQRNPNGAEELWSIPPAAGQVELLTQTLTDLSTWKTGHAREIEIVVTVDSPSLRWALRDFPGARFVPGVAVTEAPPIVITAQTEETPALAQAYHGQDFIWSRSPSWQDLLLENAVSWLVLRQAPVSWFQIILWARGDLFPGGTTTPVNDLPLP